ncbi:hypothetical protein [Helicobacter enhydrae]|uniref:hypothetical protein n=1 Tax=Helicobacter enhydrae TaxID=222136 RepID=UPI0019015D15|nr:hypothetical protein [Helicobacter enhydrae]
MAQITHFRGLIDDYFLMCRNDVLKIVKNRSKNVLKIPNFYPHFDFKKTTLKPRTHRT